MLRKGIRNQCYYNSRFLLLLSFAAHLCFGTGAAHASSKHIILIAGPKSHGVGEHEYLKSIKLLKVLLDRAPGLRGVQTDIYFNGWPEDPAVLNRADTIAFFSNGEGGFGPDSARAPFMTDERMRVLDKQIRRGCGFVTYHHSTFTPEKYASQVLSWNGGYFDWHSGKGEGGIVVAKNGALQLMNEGPLDRWHSAITDVETDVVLASPQHSISEGVSSSFRLKDEYYYQLTFRQTEPKVEPILSAPTLSPNASDQIVAWALERRAGGRGFGITAGHYFENWKNDDYRKLVLNALLWTARVAVPKGGVESTYMIDSDVDRALMEKPIPTLYLPDSFQAEESRKISTAMLAAALNSEVPRFRVDMAENVIALERDLSQYRLLVVNSCDVLRAGLYASARQGLLRFLRAGGGLAVVSTADSRKLKTVAVPGSDPTAHASMCKEVSWEEGGHQDKVNVDPSTIGGKAYALELPQKNHLITKSIDAYQMNRHVKLVPLSDFTLDDQEDILVLASVRRSGGTEMALAFIVAHRNARIYQVIAGRDLHSALLSPWLTQLVRNGSLWAAGE